MFSSALKSISSTNITANYSISPNSTSTAGPWKIYDAKKKSTGKAYSVFVFDKKNLDSHASSMGGRSGGSSFKRTLEEVIERLKKEASSLAKLRHPNILELVEPAEETRGGGLQFVTEAVTASLSSALQDKDDQERSGGPGGRSSRYVTEDADGTKKRRELEIDELEIQKGLLQISKALEFMHENAGLVHGNLTPDAILINAKSDWKISGLAFCSAQEGSTKPTSIPSVSLHEVLNLDPRLPKFVQLNLDYTSPDFVMDNSMVPSADMFSLGLLCIALYNSPHRSPLETHGSVSSYKRLFTSSSTVPSSSNSFLSKRPIPKDLAAHVLPRLITRRAAQRMTAKEFQQSEYFDNILISTIRFLDSFPAKTPNEKSQFLRGLNKVLPSFPKSVMEKKLLPALLDELKDKDLLSLILQNVFKIIELLPSGRKAFGEKVRPALKDIFVVNAKQNEEKDAARDAGLMVFLENISAAATNSSGKEFKDDILPVVVAAMECPTHSIVDAALRTLPVILPALDFSTIKNELFPVVAMVFSKTTSLAIKVRGLQAFVILCGGSNDASAADDGLSGLMQEKKAPSASASALDKYTMQEKIVPLVKAIKTKEPAVMIAALNVLRIVGDVADAEFVAMDILPALWSMSLGPLLDLKQFRQFMELIKKLSQRVEDEQTKKLQELSGNANSSAAASANDDFLAFGGVSGTTFDSSNTNGASADDFEALVKGRAVSGGGIPPSMSNGSWDDPAPSPQPRSAQARSPAVSQPATFSWSTTTTPSLNPVQQSNFRTITPDQSLNRFEPMAASSTQFSQPLQPSSNAWAGNNNSAAAANPWASSTANNTMTSSMGGMSLGGGGGPASSFSLPPPPGGSNSSSSMPKPNYGSGMAAAPAAVPSLSRPNYGGMSSTSSTAGSSMGSFGIKPPPPQQQQQPQATWGQPQQTQQTQQQQQKPASGSSLDKYQSLI